MLAPGAHLWTDGESHDYQCVISVLHVYAYRQEHMSLQRRQEGASNCVEHHFSQVEQPMSKLGIHF